MKDMNLKRVHFRIPESGVSLVEKEANAQYITEAALLRKLVIEWYNNRYFVTMYDDSPKVQMTVQLPEDVADGIWEFCEERGLTRSALIRNIIMTTLVEG